MTAPGPAGAGDGHGAGATFVLGTMTFGEQVGAELAGRLVDRCLEHGVTAIDTANVYAGGASEEILGRVLRGRRDQVTLASKVGMPSPDAGDDPPLSAPALRRCLHASLRRLDTDRLDLYYLHQPDRRTPLVETLGVLDELVREGTLGAVGVSNFAAWQLVEARALAERNGLSQPTVSQVLYNLVGRRVEDEYLECARANGVTTIAYNPLAGGLLTGKHDARRAPEPGGRFGDSGLGSRYRDRYWNDAIFTAVTALAEVAEGAGIPLVELAYRWLRWRPGVDSVLLGVSSMEQLDGLLASATGCALPAEVTAACDESWSALRGPAPSYNR